MVGRVRRGKPIALDEYRFVAGITRATPKITMPAPSTMHFWRGARYAEAGVYAGPEEFFADLGRVYQQEIADLAAAGARYVQLDEVALAMLCDPAARAKVEAEGESPERLVDLYVGAINEAVRDRPAGMVIGVHMCRGNYKGKYLAEGGYDSVAEKLFGGAQVNHFLLEFDTPRAGDFAPLRFMPKDKGVVLGMVSSKTPQLESLDLLKRRAEEAARVRRCGTARAQPSMRLRQHHGRQPGDRGRRARETEAVRRRGARDLGLGETRIAAWTKKSRRASGAASRTTATRGSRFTCGARSPRAWATRARCWRGRRSASPTREAATTTATATSPS